MIDRIDCPKACEIPAGITLTEVPRPRHAWSDVYTCPNDGCGRAFMTSNNTPTEKADGP